ncbi:MAG: DNA polymerase/3'-5' exonuclease PolX [Myxococcota bacterium]
MDRKPDVVDLLRELAELTTLDEQSPQAFRVRAYERAARAVASLVGDIEAMGEKELIAVEGIGKSTAKKIRTFLDTGHLDQLDRLREAYPPSVVALSQIPGIGPKAVDKLRRELGVTSIAALRDALEGQRLRGLAGFGAKKEEKLKDTLERLGLGEAGTDGAPSTPRRIAIAKAMPIAQRLIAALRARDDVRDAAYAGSLRRFQETIGDLDLLVVSEADPRPIMEWLTKLSMVDAVLVHGDKKTSVSTRKGLQIDMRVVAPHQYGAALLYFTGSKAHNVKLRQRALARGQTLNEYGLACARTGATIAAETEEEIYHALGLDMIAPELREDAGEIEAAEAHRLPPPVGSVFGDLHVHTDLSGDGRSPLAEVVAAARARGYRYLAITEHAEDIPRQGVPRAQLAAQRAEIEALSDDTLTVLHGAELNIGRDGSLDYDLDFRMSLDWCLASIHSHFDLPRDAQTQRLIRAMEDPSVQMIGHLTGRTIGKRPPVDLDLDAIFDAAERTETALEVNCGLPRLDVSVDILRRARDRDVVFIMTSDAHHHRELMRMDWGRIHCRRAWLDPARIVNTWSRERFMSWRQRKRARRGLGS